MSTDMLAGVWRPVTGKLLVKVAMDQEDEIVREATAGWRAQYEDGYWRVARGHLRDLALNLADLVGTCDVWVDFEESLIAKCDVRCAEAAGDECVCSCLGQNHKGAQFGWYKVGETTLIQKAGTTIRRVHHRVYGSTGG